MVSPGVTISAPPFPAATDCAPAAGLVAEPEQPHQPVTISFADERMRGQRDELPNQLLSSRPATRSDQAPPERRDRGQGARLPRRHAQATRQDRIGEPVEPPGQPPGAPPESPPPARAPPQRRGLGCRAAALAHTAG